MQYEMKDSRIEWLGNIPSHWEIKRGKNCLTLLSRPVLDEDDTITCFRDGEVTLRKNRREEGFTNALLEIGYQGVEAGDLVVHGMDGFAGAIGISDSRGKASPVLNVMDSPNCKRFLMYYLRSLANKEVFLSLSTGIRVRSCDLRWNKLAVLPFILPPLPEQTAIAAYLDEKCGAIDEIIAEAKASIEEYKAWKSSVIFEAVTKGLDPHAEMKDSGVEWMGDIPKHWKCVPMKYILQERNQKNDPIVTSERLSLSIDIGVTLYAEKTTNLDRFKEDVSQYKVAHAGDLVLNSMNMIVGAVGIAPVLGCVSPAYYIFYDNSPKHTSARFCDYVFKNRRLRGCLFSLGQGIMAIDRGDGRINTCRLKVSRDDLGRIMLPCPPEDEQEKIITYLDNRFAAIDGIIAEKEALIADMEAYKKSLIFETVTGKRKVC